MLLDPIKLYNQLEDQRRQWHAKQKDHLYVSLVGICGNEMA